MTVVEAQLQFPEKLQCLFEPKRFKVLYGGRGAGRSWGIARALLLLGAQRPLRVLCAREFQNSISDSVHKVLSDQIETMGLTHLYDVQKDRILGPKGTSFAFEGIKNNTTRIKSYEGIDVCWVEEAVKVSRQSWGILTPTIRKDDGGPFGVGSEIWMSFNPELETDYTYREFVLNADPSMMTVVRMTWRDNPWFPQVLRRELERDKINDPDRYLNVWEGHCRQILEGAVYAKELRRMQEDQRICEVPWDPEWPVDTAWDLGRADATAIWFFQRIALQHRVIDYYEVTGDHVGDVILELQRRRYIYGVHFLPHDARAKTFGTKHSIQEQVNQAYPNKVRIVPRLSVTDGINAGRLLMGKCWIDEKKCSDGLTALRHYKYRVTEEQDESIEGRRAVLGREPEHDWASHGADGWRYMAVGASQSRRGEAVEETQLGRFREAERMLGQIGRRAGEAFGWMR